MKHGSPVSDEVLHLLHRSEDLWVPGIEATVHQWQDTAAVLSRVPGQFRQAGFGGIGSFSTAAGQQMSAIHTISRLRITGPRAYRIDRDPQTLPPGRHQLETIICDGERRRRIYDDEVTTGQAEPPPAEVPAEIADLLDSSWLLARQLSGGSQTVVRGRRGYHLHVGAEDQRWGGRLSPDEVVVDAEYGIVLRWISFAGSTPVARCELRDVTSYRREPGDFQPDIRPGTRVVEEADPAEGDDMPSPNSPGQLVGDLARQATEGAKSAVQGLFGLLRERPR